MYASFFHYSQALRRTCTTLLYRSINCSHSIQHEKYDLLSSKSRNVMRRLCMTDGSQKVKDQVATNIDIHPESSPSGRIRARPWTDEEDQRLRQSFATHGPDWKRIASEVGDGRTNRGCRLRWTQSLQPSIQRGSFTASEIRQLQHLHKKYRSQWTIIAEKLGTNRTAAQVREIIVNRFQGKQVNKRWTKEEDDRLKHAVAEVNVGHWSAIAQRLPGRTDAQCYERWTFSLAPELRTGAWSEKEDDQLIQTVRKLQDSGQPFHFGDVAVIMEGVRHRKACRARYARLVRQKRAPPLNE